MDMTRKQAIVAWSFGLLLAAAIIFPMVSFIGNRGHLEPHDGLLVPMIALVGFMVYALIKAIKDEGEAPNETK